MSIKNILSVTVCALLLVLTTVSAQEKTETAPWAASLQTTTLEGFGARLTIELPPLEYCQLGRFSTKSKGNDFGFVGNTALPPRSQDTIYIGISSEETEAFSENDVVQRLSEYAHRFITDNVSSQSVPYRIVREHLIPQDRNLAWLITLAYENSRVRRDFFFIVDEGRLWRVSTMYHAQGTQQDVRMDAILTSIKLGRSDAAAPNVRFDGVQPIEFTKRVSENGDASSLTLSTTTIRDRDSILTMQLPTSGVPFSVDTSHTEGAFFTSNRFSHDDTNLALSAVLIHTLDTDAEQTSRSMEEHLNEQTAMLIQGILTSPQRGEKKILRDEVQSQNGCPARRLTVQAHYQGQNIITEILLIRGKTDIWIAELSFYAEDTVLAELVPALLSSIKIGA